MLQKIKRLYRKFLKNPPHYKITYKTKVEKLGNSDYGWTIIPNSLNERSVVYSFGIGEDISFDLSIIKKYNCIIHAFDPTPKVKTWLSSQNLPKEFIYHPIALSAQNGILTFYSPENETYVSHSIYPQPNSKAIEVDSINLSTILSKLGHQNIDLLKMDIEGFEFSVLDSLIESKIKPKQLLIEFHHFFPEFSNKNTEDMIKKLENFGYRLFYVSDSFFEYSFISK